MSCCAEDQTNLSLHDKYDLDNCVGFNVIGDVSTILRPYCQALATGEVKSDVDEELLITIRFRGTVKLHSFAIVGDGTDSTPETIKLFTHDLDLEEATETPPTQQFTHPQLPGMAEYLVNKAKFRNLSTLSVFIPTNHGSEQTKLKFLGLKGEFSNFVDAPTKFNYELVGNPTKHKLPSDLAAKSGST